MKISYKPVSGGSYTILCDESAGATPAEEFQPTFTPQIQREPLAMSAKEFRANRGNVAINLQITFNQQYATRAAAKAGIRALADALIGSNAKFHLKIDEGTDTDYYENAVVTDYRPKLNGVSVQHVLAFLTDSPTGTAPASVPPPPA